MSDQYGPHSSGARRLHTGSHPMTETTCDDNQCWCHVRNSLTDYRRHDAEAARNAAAPPLYTQAQVDALVAAAKGQVSPSTRPCCANCTHWDGRPYNWNRCRGTKGAAANGNDPDFEIRTHAHFLCVEYRPLKGEPVAPAMFSLDAKDNLNEEWHEKTAASWRDTLEGK